MIAIKENKEVKILDIQKEKYVELGYTILDDNLKVIEKPFSKEEKEIEKLQKENEELKAKLEKLQKAKEPTVVEIKAKLDELKIEYDKNANKERLIALLPKE